MLKILIVIYYSCTLLNYSVILIFAYLHSQDELDKCISCVSYFHDFNVLCPLQSQFTGDKLSPINQSEAKFPAQGCPGCPGVIWLARCHLAGKISLNRQISAIFFKISDILFPPACDATLRLSAD